jgi:hypothetical protein
LIEYPDFVSQSGNTITIDPDSCEAAAENEFSFALPSYYENLTHAF